MPFLMPKIAEFEGVREYMFRTVSQITLPVYRGRPAQPRRGRARSQAATGCPGCWCATATTSSTLSRMRCGRPRSMASPRRPLSAGARRTAFRSTYSPGVRTTRPRCFQRDALYLLRPDSYIGLVDPAGSVEALDKYIADLGLSF